MAGEVATAFVTLVPSAKGFQKATQQQISGGVVAAGTAAGKKGGKAAGLGMAAGVARFAGPAAIAGGALAIGSVLRDSVGQASNLEESINAVRVSYGSAAKGVLALGKTSATQFGLSSLALNEFAVRFSGFAGVIGKGTGKGAAKTFEDITSRATDFASVMNLEVAEAAELFQSGLAGETEPLRRFGIDMSAAATEAFAYANGIAKTGEKLTEAQKVQARYGLLLAQTDKTAGDFQNTSGGLANQQRILAAQWTDLKAQIGQGLLPVVTSFVSGLNRIMPPLMTFATQAGGIFRGLFSDGGALAGGGPFAGIINAARNLWTTMAPIFGQIVAAFRARWAEFAPIVTEIFARIREIVTTYLAIVQQVITLVTNAIRYIWQRWGASITLFLTTAFNRIITQVRNAMNVVAGIFRFVLALLKGDWSGAWQAFKDTAAAAWTFIVGSVRMGLGAIGDLLRGAMAVLRTLGGNIVGAIWTGIQSAWNGMLARIRGLISRLPGFIKRMLGIESGPVVVNDPAATAPTPKRAPSSAAYSMRGQVPTVVYNTTVNNPKPEKASDSVPVALRRVAYR